jgi:hypothetical protein
VGTAFFRALDALRIDDRRSRARLTCRLLAAFDIERVVDALQRSVPTPAAEVIIHRAACRQILRDRAPLAAGAEDVHKSVDDLAQVDRALVATWLGPRKQGRDLRPFFVGQVALVAQAAAVIAAAVLLGPHPGPPVPCRGRKMVVESVSSRGAR